jgi:Uncharacterized protein conserved in bacteria
MKKRLIGTLLMGALFVSSTSVFVSCKDYDDDINNIVATKADKTELQQVKTALENEISSLKTQLSAIEGQITTLTNNKANKLPDGSDLVDVWNTLKPLLEKTSNLEASIAQAESAIANINSLLGGKLEGDLTGKTYKEALELTFAKVAAVSADLTTQMAKIEGLEDALNNPTTGLKAVVADLQSQVSALDAYKAKIDAIQADYLKAADKTELLNKIDAVKTELQGKIDALNTTLTAAIATAKSEANTYADGKASAALDAAKSYTNAELEKVGITITSLTNDMQTLSGKVDETAALANNLNVYVRQALRGLVFNMDSYYQGVEATDITVLYFRKYTLNAAGPEIVEEWGYNSTIDWTADTKKFAPWTKGIIGAIVDVDAAAHKAAAAQAAVNYEEHKHIPAEVLKTTRYAYTTATRVLQFRAKYFMNPSSAKVDNEAGTVKVVATDKPFHSSIEWTDTLQKDVEFNGKTTDYCAGIKVKEWKTENGMLIVDYDCTDPDKIRQISKDDAITVFATQVQVANDTTITSDFAAVYKQDVKDIRIAHTLSSTAAMLHNGQYIGSHAAADVNTHCGYCALEDANHEYHAGLHLMQTVGEAAGLGTSRFKDSPAGGFAPQDSVGYTDSLNLNKLVEVHYTVYDPNGQNATHLKMSAKDMEEKFGVHFEFELTGLYYGSNETSESAHAAIKLLTAADGVADSAWYLRPQMPDTIFDATTGHYHGTWAPWDNNGVKKGVVGKQDRQTIGRTPIVRVKLLDNDGNILDYGYIRIKIVDRPYVKPVIRTIVNYNAGKMTARQNWCAELGGDAFNWKQTWGEMEYDLHHMLDISQGEFEANYTYVGANNIFTQYYMEGGVIKACSCLETPHKHANDTLGVIKYIPNIEDEQTSVIEWNVTAQDLKKYIDRLGNNAANLPRYIKFHKTGLIDGPDDVYVCITPAGLEITKEPAVYGIVAWNNKFNKKNENYWYQKNANAPEGDIAPKGFAEIHANVLAVEDKLAEGWQDICKVLDTKLPDVFSSNDGGNANELVNLTNDGMNAWVTTNSGTVKGKDLTALTLDFAVADSLKNTKYTGNNGQEYKMTVRAKKNGATGKALIGYIDANNNNKLEEAVEVYDTIATLEIVGVIANKRDSINHFRIDYHNNYIADALLNYKAHNQLADDVLNVVVAAKAWFGDCEVPLYDNTLSARFLRPINVFSNDYEVEDASTNGEPQIINMRDLVRFTDWRDEPFKVDALNDYWHYYNIKAIKPTNVPNGGKLSSNTKVTTNMDGATTPVSLATKTQSLDFVYNDATPATPKAVGDYGTADSFGWLVYSNLSNTVQEFDVWVPVTVTYEWGDIYTTVKIHIKKSKNNARQN